MAYSDREYTIESHLATISEHKTTRTKELNLISWGDGDPCYDLRIWNYNDDTGERTPGKGLTLTAAELEALKEAIR